MNRLLLFVSAILITVATAQSADRVALVVGNSAYRKAPLENPRNDAREMTRTLGKLGFQVIAKQDLEVREFTDEIRRLSRSVDRGGIALFFFAGHGLQVKGENYLMPVGADVEEEFDVEHECVALDRVLAAMEASESGLNIVFLDCCRNNPYKRGWRRSTETGLASTLVPEGTLISFAAAPGREALDGTGQNSPFTEALLAHLSRPGSR